MHTCCLELSDTGIRPKTNSFSVAVQNALSNVARLGMRPATQNCQRQLTPERYPMQLVLGSLVNPRNGSDLADT
eukprot:11203190-Lingulodinium_polyedra.AAC.1